MVVVEELSRLWNWELEEKEYTDTYLCTQFISDDHINIILQVYCITGCDTCCACYGIGKKNAFNVMMNDCKETAFFNSRKKAAIEFVSALYWDSDCNSLNEIRIKKVKDKKSTNSGRLPPTDDAFPYICSDVSTRSGYGRRHWHLC